ncbi:putative motility protein [Anaerobacillus sp. HL2]|nr:putative motility protein [Anaerobacillus sp. HL2]
MSLLKSTMNTQFAQAISMLDDMTQAQPNQVTSAPHPTLGTIIDTKG